ncbi:unnamed protein product [Albugo candida]|uniref:Dolichol phosphate-mannose biosynthesis regulatory protein n=1 Tax=Albugo candida TaxID=65357 RepID=A0A024GPF5_9STRA|nr:unnamed protein product [Albugo candida]|eukprot:CCI48615.1 unnamed protein product [Albugo candida]
MGASDRTAGMLVLSITSFLYSYYTIWVILTPFIDSDHPVQRLFAPYHFALVLPAIVLVLLFTIAVTYIGTVMIQSKPHHLSTNRS